MTNYSWHGKVCGLLYNKKNSYLSELEEEDRRRRDRRIPRAAIKSYCYSTFFYLYNSGNDQALLTATGHDHRSFKKLLKLFEPIFAQYTWDDNIHGIRKKQVRNNGMPISHGARDMTASACLGSVLMWYRTRGSCARGLAAVFGQSSTSTYKWLKFGRKALLHVLCKDQDAMVTLPTESEIRQFVNAINVKYPVLTNVWAAADGLKLLIHPPSSHAKQNMFFNGWKHTHNVNCLFVFSPDGKIRICLLNAPGTFHDSTMADYGVYVAMERVYEEFGARVVVDSAFNIGKKDFILKSSQQDPLNEHELLLNRAATSVRQLSEWGMRMIGGSFPRLKDPMKVEKSNERLVILRLMVHLYTFQIVHVGINQILNTFFEMN